jgi:hypothetical protein
VCRFPLRLGGKLLRRDANGNLFGTTLNGAAITDVDFTDVDFGEPNE